VLQHNQQNTFKIHNSLKDMLLPIMWS